MALQTLNNVTPAEIERISTTIAVLDKQFGGGLPKGKITGLTGASGTGKSRTLVEIGKQMIQWDGRRIYYMSGELPAGEFVTEKLSGFASPLFSINRTDKLADVVSDIVASQAELVIIDSINTIVEFKNGRGGKLVIDGDSDAGIRGLRWAAEQHGAHVVCIVQQNQDGSMKGGTEFLHMADIEVRLLKYGDGFKLVVGKNRYGKSDTETFWHHTDQTVVCDGDRESIRAGVNASSNPEGGYWDRFTRFITGG